MQNKKLVLSTLVAVIAFFVGFSFFYKNDSKSTQNIAVENINELLVRDYSYKMGDNSKNISVVEFLDPECESCAIYSTVVKRLYKEYYGDIQIVVKYLDNHKNSRFTIQILEAARVQGKYEEVLDMMFEKHSLWASHYASVDKPELLWQFLKEISDLDIEKLKEDMKNPKIDEIIKQDREDANALGVRGTPTIFVNGKQLQELSQKALFDLVEKEIYK
ncbi:DsbA family protein [Aliarcobacter skirrowii]|jgi:protein-disulfide isomerase|uniref:Disulfide bond formation protein DsbA n=1 Tax=Aliarcobacter skirrowii CCUG 10374 TaxID=1032239 RepID=A0AAD0SMF1_9BACT|nr:thioredoxin domain-containing protein [Aliarcobacter skirrowii]AXX84813.1 protein disulfide oxidoreductase, DsbA/G family [Aliarcobacter skirrowii CCUG 10374]KAB0620392.1 DsbA family protein [Aliarcobacter skirrowii CCUG 10374]MDX4057813.1 thioredoxin domain-containing protein [Aliarcobacter skirrowii]MDX4061923.1 thioredoxin domain-containing protein [Aliarcobacter skirrowii]MDX4063688.1 thioredoxin domain-containing protein [Aliarcobacter skirrowii]